MLRVGALRVGDRRELCLIKNISAGGMMIRAYSRIEPGARVAVELKQGEAARGVVRWAKEDYVGVSFDSPIDVVALISAQTDGQRPRMPRVEVHCSAWVRQDATVHRTKVFDISQGGIKIECRDDLAIGADVAVTLIGLPPRQGVVRWKSGTAYGITFNGVLALSQLVAWLQEQRERPRAAGKSLA